MHSLLHRPELGWDPVPASQVQKYAAAEYDLGVSTPLVDLLDNWCGGLKNKTVLDLGGGPGHYTLEFARRGAKVTWYDVSAGYQSYAKSRCKVSGLDVQFSIGYLDHAGKTLRQQYDLVFNRLCWYYCFNDAEFAHMLYNLARDGGVIYVDTHHSESKRVPRTGPVRWRTLLNEKVGLKVGHPFPPKGRVPALFLQHQVLRMSVDYSTPDNERVLLQKA